MSQEWDIKPRGESCHKCQTPFIDNQAYYSVLQFGSEGYQRGDFCDNCKPDSKSIGIVSYWKGLYKTPPPPPEEALKKETAESLLRKLIEDNDATKVNVIYILAVMLERKRILVERDIQTRDDGNTIRVYEHRATGDSFLITEPHLQLNQLEHVQLEVINMLGGPKEKKPQAEGAQVTEES